MSLGTLCRGLALLVGVQPAAVWAPNEDVNAAELVAWVNEAQQRVAAEHDWQVLLRDFQAPVTAPEQAFVLPADFARLVPDSLWLVGIRWRVQGPVSVAEWEERKRRLLPTVVPIFALSQGQILLRSPYRSETMTGRYVAVVPDMATDAAVSALGAGLERLILLCAVALYRDAKGLPTQNAAAQYQSALSLARARDLPVGMLSLSGGLAGDGAAPPVARGVGFILDVAVLG